MSVTNTIGKYSINPKSIYLSLICTRILHARNFYPWDNNQHNNYIGLLHLQHDPDISLARHDMGGCIRNPFERKFLH